MTFDVSLVSAAFVATLGAVALLRAALPARWRVVVAAAASALLVGIGSPATLALLAGLLLFVVYPASRLIVARRETSPRTARFVLGLGIAVTLGSWLVFKANREVDLSGVVGSRITAELLAVVGFSYFIFRAVNVLAIHYWVGEVPGSNPVRLLYYGLFPPTITSGPIHKYADFCRELESPARLDGPALVEAAERITRGYFYKICVVPLLQGAADGILADDTLHAHQSLALTVLMYALVFFDFAGYSHIAIGLARLLGVRVPENFRRPFTATSLTEFWRHWHITIGDWFRDHVFIPLGGMRLGGRRAAVLAGGIMFACGLWHGLTPLFVAWGAWHASHLLLEGLTGSRPLPHGERRGPRFWARVAWTNGRVAFGSIFFLPTNASVGAVLEGFLRW
jgi:alginate O-acetyltransferase complex protein AlgI